MPLSPTRLGLQYRLSDEGRRIRIPSSTMATALGDIGPPVSHFRDVISTSSIAQSRPSLHYQSSNITHPKEGRLPREEPTVIRHQTPISREAPVASHTRGNSPFPSPPSSSTSATPLHRPPEIDCAHRMESNWGAAVHPPHYLSAAAIVTKQQPSLTSDEFAFDHHRQSYEGAGHSFPTQNSAHTIHIKDLAHIQSLGRPVPLGAGTVSGSRSMARETKYDISRMPIADIIEMVAALLAKMTTMNDLQHHATQRHAAHQQKANHGASGATGSPANTSTSVLAFHGRNIPSITILLYLSRIQRYCPTTFEVFLSLLVYFDRMTERVNYIIPKSSEPAESPSAGILLPVDTPDLEITDDSSDASAEPYSELVDDDDDVEENDHQSASSCQLANQITGQTPTVPAPASISPTGHFVVDSFNIHRLIIAGVTCSSKFFSDVFYTNSRYARVGGLPLVELNHLELQFLVLNNFRLAIRLEDLEAYATMLVEFYAREVLSLRSRPLSGAVE